MARANGGRGRLLVAAERLFRQKAFESVSIRELITSASVTRSVLYHHFGSKEGIFRAAFRESEAELESTVERAVESRGPAAARIVEVCRALANATHQRGLGGAHGAPAIRDRIVGIVRDMLEEGVLRGEFVTCESESLATALVASAEFAGRLPEYDDIDFENRAGRAVSAVLHGISDGTERVDDCRTDEDEQCISRA